MVKHVLPTSLQEALELLQQTNYEIIAGGTDLMVQRRSWANTPPRFERTMNIMHITELQQISVVDQQLHIGSTVCLSDVLDYPDTPELLKQAIRDIASPALRNLATIAGNIGNASPAGDTLPILYALNAIVELQRLGSVRQAPIKDIITGPRKTTIEPDELITKIILPLDPFTKTVFVKVGGRKADAISKVSFTGAVRIHDDVVEDIRICFGAVAPVVVRNTNIEAQMIHQKISTLQSQLDLIVSGYMKFIQPIDDQRSNKQYRKTVAINLLKDFIANL